MLFDIKQFEADVWYYSELDGVIRPDTWEEIVAHSVDGKRILGDHFMADVHNDMHCFNVKSIKEQSPSKTGNKTVEYVQCRTPITNDRSLSQQDLSQQILKTLDDKLQESLITFKCDKMIDVIILHNRYDKKYHASVYVIDHPDYSTYPLEWSDGEGRVDANGPWLIKRRWSDDNHRQTCTSIKKKYLKTEMAIDIYVDSIDHHNISKEEILNKYNLHVKGEL